MNQEQEMQKLRRELINVKRSISGIHILIIAIFITLIGILLSGQI